MNLTPGPAAGAKPGAGAEAGQVEPVRRTEVEKMNAPKIEERVFLLPDETKYFLNPSLVDLSTVIYPFYMMQGNARGRYEN